MNIVCLVLSLCSFYSTLVLAALSAAEKRDLLAQINGYRCMHGSPPLMWDDCVAKGAQLWADHNESKNFEGYKIVPCMGPFGDTLAKSPKSMSAAVAAWYAQKKIWEKNRLSGFQEAARSFTTMIWRGTTQVGCGINRSSKLLICHYKSSDTIDCNFPNFGPASCFLQQVLLQARSEQQCTRLIPGFKNGIKAISTSKTIEPLPAVNKVLSSKGSQNLLVKLGLMQTASRPDNLFMSAQQDPQNDCGAYGYGCLNPAAAVVADNDAGANSGSRNMQDIDRRLQLSSRLSSTQSEFRSRVLPFLKRILARDSAEGALIRHAFFELLTEAAQAKANEPSVHSTVTEKQWNTYLDTAWQDLSTSLLLSLKDLEALSYLNLTVDNNNDSIQTQQNAAERLWLQSFADRVLSGAESSSELSYGREDSDWHDFKSSLIEIADKVVKIETITLLTEAFKDRDLEIFGKLIAKTMKDIAVLVKMVVNNESSSSNNANKNAQEGTSSLVLRRMSFFRQRATRRTSAVQKAADTSPKDQQQQLLGQQPAAFLSSQLQNSAVALEDNGEPLDESAAVGCGSYGYGCGSVIPEQQRVAAALPSPISASSAAASSIAQQVADIDGSQPMSANGDFSVLQEEDLNDESAQLVVSRLSSFATQQEILLANLLNPTTAFGTGLRAILSTTLDSIAPSTIRYRPNWSVFKNSLIPEFTDEFNGWAGQLTSAPVDENDLVRSSVFIKAIAAAAQGSLPLATGAMTKYKHNVRLAVSIGLRYSCLQVEDFIQQDGSIGPLLSEHLADIVDWGR